MGKSRGLNPAIFIALADVMMCLAGRLILEHNMGKIELEIEIARLEEQKAEAAQDLVDAKASVASIEQAAIEEQKRLDEETAAKKAELDGRISDLESQLADRQDDFQNWDLVVHRYLVKTYPTASASTATSVTTPAPAPPPRANLYARTDGVYRDGSKKKMSDAEVRAWLIEQVATVESGDRLVLALWQENGANDNYLRMERLVYDTPELSDKMYLHAIVLPDGVRAGSK